jgi:endonuclease/exonuclease/phosphatase family metal-dependent hydrolase
MFKIATLNIAYHSDKHGPWGKRREAIVRALAASQADVVALQAVERAHGADLDQASELARALPTYEEVVFHPAQQKSDNTAQGSALLARSRFAYTDHLQLSLRPGLEDANRRIVLHGRMMYGETPLNIFNAHLSWVPEQNTDNVRETIAYVRRFDGDGVLAGDFNAQADQLDALREHGWHDVWHKLRPRDPGFTFEAGKASMRIDYIWVSASLEKRVRSIEIIADTERASDHYGLLAVLD